MISFFLTKLADSLGSWEAIKNDLIAIETKVTTDRLWTTSPLLLGVNKDKIIARWSTLADKGKRF